MHSKIQSTDTINIEDRLSDWVTDWLTKMRGVRTHAFYATVSQAGIVYKYVCLLGWDKIVRYA